MIKTLSLPLAALLLVFCCNAQNKDTSNLDPVIEVDKMNVLYIGVDNPVSIAVPGFGSEKISATISDHATLKQTSPGNYIVQVQLVGKTEIKVFVTMPDGSQKFAGSKIFRVHRVPDPIATIGGKEGGTEKPANFSVQKGIVVAMEGFDYDVKFTVVSFEMSYASWQQDLISLTANGPLFTEQMLNIVTKCQQGDNFFFDKIKVKMPDGTIRQIRSMMFKII